MRRVYFVTRRWKSLASRRARSNATQAATKRWATPIASRLLTCGGQRQGQGQRQRQGQRTDVRTVEMRGRSFSPPLSRPCTLSHSVISAALGTYLMHEEEDRQGTVGQGPELPDALAQALQTLRGHCGGKVVCVFGCGGERDHGKRSEMGAIAERLADHTIVTSDNPRNENPQDIIDSIVAGITADGSYEVVADRADAITRAISNASAGDAVLVAGKGCENYQLIADRVEAFSDQDVAARALGVAS